MDPARALLLAVLTVAAMATTTAAMAAPAPGPDTTATGEVCDLIAGDTAGLIRQIPLVKTLAGGHDVTPDQIAQARVTLGCGPAPERTEAEARAALCGSLTVDAVDRLLVATNASDQVRRIVDGVSDAALEAALSSARGSLGCAAPGGEVTFADCAAVRLADATPLLAGEPGYRVELDADRDGTACESLEGDPDSQVRIKPIGGVATGGWGGPE